LKNIELDLSVDLYNFKTCIENTAQSAIELMHSYHNRLYFFVFLYFLYFCINCKIVSIVGYSATYKRLQSVLCCIKQICLQYIHNVRGTTKSSNYALKVAEKSKSHPIDFLLLTNEKLKNVTKANYCLRNPILNTTTSETEETESIERFIEGQTLSLLYDSAPRSPPPPLFYQDVRPTTHKKTEKERQLADGDGRGVGGKGMGVEPNHTTAKKPGPL
jgi:hypothetical protein